jgi:hypothetical protein
MLGMIPGSNQVMTGKWRLARPWRIPRWRSCSSPRIFSPQSSSLKRNCLLLAARRRGDLTVIPVFLNHSNVDLVCEELTRIQGYGSPQQPLSTLRPGEQEKIYAELSRRITELADAAPSVRPPASRRSVQSLPVGAEARFYELTVHLERNGKNLDTYYLLPGDDPFLSTSRTWADKDRYALPLLYATLS